MSTPLKRMGAVQFARYLELAVRKRDTSFVFFIGAGCSVSSGIPTAGSLVQHHWLPILRDQLALKWHDLDGWAKENIADADGDPYDPNKPAAFYGAVMGKLFHNPEERQREIDRLCDGRYPGFGYAVLASLMARDGGHFNVVLTTNFDDLVADALYLFNATKPLVIHHESLANYIRSTRTRPLVVKLHGDRSLSPKNTAIETAELNSGITKGIQGLLQDRGLVFLGYGGNDLEIKRTLEALPADALPFGVYWLSQKEPNCALREWLEKREGYWVEASDFDEAMLLIQDSVGFAHPGSIRFDGVFERYFKSYLGVSARVYERNGAAEETTVLQRAIRRADVTFTDWRKVELDASQHPSKVQEIYEQGLKQFPGSAPLFGNYANFLTDIRKDPDRAEAHYRQALKADPKHAGNLGNYAVFLADIREDPDRAEEYYRRALEADPENANNLGNYALFLANIREAPDRAEEHYRRTVEADPNRADNVGNYAGFLLGRGRREEGLSKLDHVLTLSSLAENLALAAECWFYALVHRPLDRQTEALKELKAILSAGGRSPGWDLGPHLAQAKAGGRADLPWLEKLAGVISDGADIATLDGWAEWSRAS